MREFGPLKSEVPRPTPFLKWAGGKGQLLDQLEKFLPAEYRTYFEPFLGGGALFFRLLPKRAILSDSNPDLINAFQVVRDKPRELMEALDNHRPHRRSKDYFYKVRAMDPGDMDAMERAARTIFLNKTCYNGLYRVNSQGRFNVPYGSYTNPTLYDRDNLLAASAALQGKTILAKDYRDSLKVAREGDFVYLDPPYQPLSPTASFTGYTKDAFNRADQEGLAALFRKMHKQGCRLLLSNSATPYIRGLYAGFTMEAVKAARAINCKGSGRGAIDELLVMSYG